MTLATTSFTAIRKAELPIPDSVLGFMQRLFDVVSNMVARWEAELTAWALEEHRKLVEKLMKSGLEPHLLGMPLKKVGDPPFLDGSDYRAELEQILASLADHGAADAAFAAGVILGRTPPEALDFAQERAAELVGMKNVGGQWVTNPNPEWAITETLREATRKKVVAAIKKGMSPQQLTALLAESFKPARAATIARTETAFSYAAGAELGYREAGVSFVQIQDGKGCLPKGHRDNAPKASGAIGVVELEHEAQGQVWTLAQYREHKIGHPNCVRAAVPFFPDGEDALP